jgi:hypothetical protein
MFTPTTAEQALSLGFTHHASYYGIPVWVNSDLTAFTASPKYRVTIPLVVAISFVELLVGSAANVFRKSGKRRGYRFRVGEEIPVGHT